MHLPAFVDYAEAGYKAINRTIIIPVLHKKVNKMPIVQNRENQVQLIILPNTLRSHNSTPVARAASTALGVKVCENFVHKIVIFC